MRAQVHNLSRKHLATVLAIALAARLLVLWLAVAHHGAKWLFTRGVEIGFVANSVITGHGFSSPFGGDTGPTALIAPGYPLLVAAVFKVLGTYSATSAIVIMLAQVALNLATIVLMMKFARAIAGTSAALIAGLFWACWPPFLWMPTIFWETSLSALMLLGMLMFAMNIAHKPRAMKWAAFGVLMGLVSLINMALLITLCGVFLWLVVQTYRENSKSILLAAALSLLVFSPWPIRNARAFHAFVPLRTTVGLELWIGNHDGSTGYLEESLFPMYNHGELNEYLRVGEVQYDREKSATAHAWIKAHPLSFAKLSAERFLRFWIGTGSRGGSPIFALGAIATSIGGFLGLLNFYKRGNKSLAVLYAIPLVCFPLPYYITHAEFRYRLVVDPLLTVFTAFWLTARAKSAADQAAESHSAIDPEMTHLVA